MGSRGRLWLVYLGGFLTAVHFASVSYVNSSLLKQFVGDSALNILYILGSLLGIVLLFAVPLFLRKYGSVPVFLFFLALEILAVLNLGNLKIAAAIAVLFAIHLATDFILYFCIDINLEQETEVEGTTGSKRGSLLMISNIAWVFSPLMLTLLVTQNNFGKIYWLSGLALVPLLVIVGMFFKNTRRARISDSNIFRAVRSLWKQGDQIRIMGAQFVLNFFYAWMVIYMPLLLSQEMGFSWAEIGIMFTIMLTPFMLFQLPAGILGDRKWGEKEILTVGFIIMSLATLVVPILKSPVFWVWAAVLFITRIGASLVEVSSESYFFKHVKESNTGVISIFRMARPLSFIIAPAFAIPIIYFFSYSASFYFLSFFSILGLFFIPKKDTR